jgi:hypothetical protein
LHACVESCVTGNNKAPVYLAVKTRKSRRPERMKQHSTVVSATPGVVFVESAAASQTDSACVRRTTAATARTPSPNYAAQVTHVGAHACAGSR